MSIHQKSVGRSIGSTHVHLIRKKTWKGSILEAGSSQLTIENYNIE